MKEKRGKKGLSTIVGVVLVIILAIISVGIIGTLTFSMIEKNTEKFTIQTELLKEKFEMKKVLINPSDPSKINITFCCASSSKLREKKEVIIEEEETMPMDFSLVIDRSGSMRQSGWTLDLQGISPSQEYLNVNVPRDAYSSSNSFNVPAGTERLAVSLDWGRKSGYIGSEGSEFALNVRDPTGTWIFGNNRPGVGGIVDPPTNVAGPDEYFSGISTKPQIVYIENPTSGDWDVKVYGWNLRPNTNRPDSQDVNISIFNGTSAQIIKNPTIISIDAAKSSAKDFTDNLGNDNFLNYVVFGSYGELKQTLTDNKNLLNTAIDNTGLQGGTAIHTGIQTSMADLINNGRPSIEKIMILLTDGQNDAGPDIVIQEAQNAKNQDIRIITIGLTGFVDSDMLTAVASTSEDYYYAPDASVLQTIFEEIRLVTIKRSFSEMLSEKFKIIFYNETNSYSEEITEFQIGPSETKKFVFDLTDKITNIIKIDLYPVKTTKGGKEIIGPLLQTYVVK